MINESLLLQANAAYGCSLSAVEEGGGVQIIQCQAEDGALPQLRATPAYSGGPLRPTLHGLQAGDRPIYVNLDNLHLPPSVPAYRGHVKPWENRERDGVIVGHWTTLEVRRDPTGHQLLATGVASGTDREVVTSGQNGFPWSVSVNIQFNGQDVVQLSAGQNRQVNGRSVRGPALIVDRGNLVSIDFVVQPGDPQARAAFANRQEINMGFEAWVATLGLVIAELSAETVARLQAEYDRLQSLQAAAPEPDASAQGAAQTTPDEQSLQASAQAAVQARRQVEAAEESRLAEIRALCQQYDPDSRLQAADRNNQLQPLRTLAIRDGWSPQQTELVLLRAQRRANEFPAAHSDQGASAQLRTDALVCAVMAQAGFTPEVAVNSNLLPASLTLQGSRMPQWWLQAANADYRQQVLEASRNFAEITTMDLVRVCAEIDERRSFLGASRNAALQAAFAGLTLTNVLNQLVTAAVAQDFVRTLDDMSWVGRIQVDNFNEEKEISIDGAVDLLPHLPGGTAREVSFSDSAQGYRCYRLSRMATIDEMVLINDRLRQVLQKIRTEFSWGAAQVGPKLAYATLMANPLMADSVNLFHATHNNVVTLAGTSEAQLVAAIAEAVTKLSLQKDKEGESLNLEATHLLCPPALALLLNNIVAASETRAASASGGVTRNIAYGIVRNLVRNAKLQNGVTHPLTRSAVAGSASTMFLVDASSGRPPVSLITRTGAEGPQVRSFALAQGRWGVGYDIVQDQGVTSTEWRTGVRISL